ncbi:hypothetical protein [Halovenus sp. HT40]|uniref:hypothetical protein n=1 Tax=Halovenus sp. HT40 TaxID=3126691 RepID=UPI00300E7227
MSSLTITTTVGNVLKQSWRDLLSIYYANTPIWRWLKSGALLFLGFGLWAGGSAVHSVTGWQPVLYVMAYGFLLIVWGPFTHMLLIPFTIRLRRTAESKPARVFSRNSGKINLSIFFVCVIALATFAPGVMLLDFSGSPGSGGGEVTGNLICESGETAVSCEVENPQGFDRVVVVSGGETVRTVTEEPFTFEIPFEELEEISSGHRFVVEYQDSNGNTLRRFVERVE